MPGFHFQEAKGYTEKCTFRIVSPERIAQVPTHQLDPGLDVDRILGIVSVCFVLPCPPLHSFVLFPNTKQTTESSWHKLTVPLSPLGSQGKGGKVGRETSLMFSLATHRSLTGVSQIWA